MKTRRVRKEAASYPKEHHRAHPVRQTIERRFTQLGRLLHARREFWAGNR